MPKISVKAAVASASFSELKSDSRKSSEPNTSEYQRVEKPWKGKVSEGLECSEKSATMISGTSRNTSTRAVKSAPAMPRWRRRALTSSTGSC